MQKYLIKVDGNDDFVIVAYPKDCSIPSVTQVTKSFLISYCQICFVDHSYIIERVNQLKGGERIISNNHIFLKLL